MEVESVSRPESKKPLKRATPRASSVQTGTADKPLKIELIKTENELESLRQAWTQRLDHPNTDLDFFLSIVDGREQVIRPHVLSVSHGENIVAIIAGRLEHANFDLRVGYRVFMRPKLMTLRIIHGNNFETLPQKIQQAILAELREDLRQNGAEILVFDSLQAGSAMDLAIRSGVSPLFRKCFTAQSPHWQIKLPDSFDDYMLSLSRTTRKGLRRRIRSLEQKYGESLSVRRLSSESEFEPMLDDMMHISEKTYQYKIGSGFRATGEIRRTMLMALQAGRLCSLVVYLDGEPVAFDNATRYGKTLYLDNTGFNPGYAEDGFGTYLLLKQIESAFDDGLIDTIDFGSGDSSYKTSLCNDSWDELSTYIIAPGLKGIALNIFCTATTCAHNFTSHALKRIGVFEKIRNFFRRRKSSASED